MYTWERPRFWTQCECCSLGPDKFYPPYLAHTLCRYHKEELVTILHRLFKKMRGGNISQFIYESPISTLKQGKDARRTESY